MASESVRNAGVGEQGRITILPYSALPSEAKIIARHEGGSVPTISQYLFAWCNQEVFEHDALGHIFPAQDKRGQGFSGKGVVQDYNVVKYRGDWDSVPNKYKVNVDSSVGNQVSIGFFEDMVRIEVSFGIFETLQSVAVIKHDDAGYETSSINRVNAILRSMRWRETEAWLYDGLALPIEHLWNKSAKTKEERDNVLRIGKEELYKEFKNMKREDAFAWLVSLLPYPENSIEKYFGVDVSGLTSKVFEAKILPNIQAAGGYTPGLAFIDAKIPVDNDEGKDAAKEVVERIAEVLRE